MAYTLFETRNTKYCDSGTSTPSSSGDIRFKCSTYYEQTPEDIVANQSRLKLVLQYQIGGYAVYLNGGSIYANVDGVRKATGSIPNGTTKAKGTYAVKTVEDIIIQHDADGKKTFTLYLNGSEGAYGSKSFTYNYTLPDIPRYANITSFNCSATTLNTATINWGADASCDWVQYSLNGGGWIDAGGTTFNINSLTPATQYSLKIKVRRTDSQLWTESGTIYFTTLRYATITGANNINDEENPSMTFNTTQEGAINVWIECNPVGIHISRDNIPNTGSYLFNLSDAERNILRSAIVSGTSGTLRYGMTTVSGNSSYQSFVDKSISLINYKPTFENYTFADTNPITVALTGNNQNLIKGKSTLVTTISSANKMIANKQATPVSYRTNVGSKSATAEYSSNNDVNMTLDNIDGGIIYVTATDSRGNSESVTKTTTIYEHSAPVISNMGFERQGGISSTVNIIGSGTYATTNFGAYQNTITKIEYSLDNGSTWSDITSKFNISNGAFSNKSSGNTATGFTVGTEYNVIFRVIDGAGEYILSSSTSNFSLTSGEPLLDINKTKKSLGINCIADEENAIMFNGEVIFLLDE